MKKPPRSRQTSGEQKSRKRKAGDRGFDEIPLFSVGSHRGLVDRYSSDVRADLPLPYLNAYRNNLTALSQHHNLYFVASESSLLVYQPTFPTQDAPPRSGCRLPLPKSRPRLRGYMPHAEPHSVNHIIVADLGDQEIVLCACDDGDVVGYWTKDILRWVEETMSRRREIHQLKMRARRHQRILDEDDRRPGVLGCNPRPTPIQDRLEEASRAARQTAEQEARPAEPNPQLRPAFHENVGISVWGLAVHKEARLIAVSSNAAKITVWAHALSKAKEPTAEELEYDGLMRRSCGGILARHGFHHMMIPDEPEDGRLQSLWLKVPFSAEHRLSLNRDCDQSRVLGQHKNNIPSIAFCNTAEDERGTYLASTDITGVTMIWNVDRNYPVRIMKAQRPQRIECSHDVHPDRMGWGVAFLDKRSYRPTKSIVEAMGTCTKVSGTITSSGVDSRKFNLWKRDLTLYDISDSRPMVRNTGRWEGLNTPLSHGDLVSPDTSTLQDETEDEDEDDMEAPYNGMNAYDIMDVALAVEESDTPPPPPTSYYSFRKPALTSGTYRNNLTGKMPDLEAATLPVDIPGIEEYVETSDLKIHDSRWPLFSYDSLHAGRYDDPSQPSPIIPPPHEMPDSPLMLLEPRTIHLFQSPSLLNPPNGESLPHSGNPVRSGTDPRPTIFIEDPLAQDASPDLLADFHHDKLNMVVQLPDFGVLLVGNPKGRVAVFTLQQLIPDPLRERNNIEEPVYTMRLDHILPTSGQEEEGLRPRQQLVGVSAGPVFGKSGRRAEDRCRVLMLYRDHTLLAYEVWRAGCGPFDRGATGVKMKT